MQSRFSNIKFSDNLQFSCYLVILQTAMYQLEDIKLLHLVTVFNAETKSVTKSRMHCTYYWQISI